MVVGLFVLALQQAVKGVPRLLLMAAGIAPRDPEEDKWKKTDGCVEQTV